MVGPRRPATRRSAGTWYRATRRTAGESSTSSTSPEALGIPGIPAFFMGESPADMADFVEYVNGPADSTWG